MGNSADGDDFPQSGARGVARNAATGAAASVFAIALGLISTPALVNSLGQQAYGVYALVTSFQAYLGILDFGIGGSLPRFFVKARSDGDQLSIRRITSFGIMFYALGSLILLPAVLGLSPKVAVWLNIPSSFRRPMSEGIRFMFLLFFAASISGVLAGRISAMHRMYISSLSNIAGVSLFVTLVVVALPRHPTVTFALLCLGSQVALVMTMQAAYLIWVDGWRLLASPLGLGKLLAREILGFGMWTQVNSISSVTNLEADKVIIARVVGVSSVAPYQVANRFALLTRALPNQFLGAIFPFATSKLSAGAGEKEIEELYTHGSRYLMLLTLLVSGALVSASGPFLQAWIGFAIPGAQQLAIALIISYAINNLTGLGTTIVRAQGFPRLETYYGIVGAFSNIVLTILLTQRFGLAGVVAGTVLGNILGSGFFLVIFHKYTRIPFLRSVWTWLFPLLLSVVPATIAGLAFSNLAEHLISAHSRPLQALACGASISVYALCSAVLLRVTQFWTPSDIAHVRRAWQRFATPTLKRKGVHVSRELS